MLLRVTVENERKMLSRQFENERKLWEGMNKEQYKEMAGLRWEGDSLRKALAEKQGQVYSRGVERKEESKAATKLIAIKKDGITEKNAVNEYGEAFKTR